MPFPVPETGLTYQPENENSISFTSEFIVYNPRLKYTMNFPEINFCGESDDILLIVGSFPAVSTMKRGLTVNNAYLLIQKKRKPLEIIFATDGINEAFHIVVDIKNEVVQRWAVVNNETQEILGEPGEGTSIDLDEPFVIRYQNIIFISFFSI